MPPAPGCKCRYCYGLAEYMANLTGHTHGLSLAKGHATQQLPLVAEKPCTRRLDCPCDKCSRERRQHLTIVKARASEPERQPWEPRPSRHKRAA